VPSFLSPLLKEPDRALRLVNSRNEHVVATRLMTAFDSESRRTGLLKHAAMPQGAALIIAPCSAVHTIGMKFAIDVAFVSREGRVLKVRHAVKPWRMTGALRAFAVIELAAGVLAAADIRPGDSLAAAE
jgi:uncharacterized protein